ncbi:MAG: hypothetical protein AABW56_02660 [Nanoarchaeota archaeon]
MKINQSEIEYHDYFESLVMDGSYPTLIIIPFIDLKENDLQTVLDSLEWNTYGLFGNKEKMIAKNREDVEYRFISMLYKEGKRGNKTILDLDKNGNGTIFIRGKKAENLEESVLKLVKALNEESELSERLVQEC